MTRRAAFFIAVAALVIAACSGGSSGPSTEGLSASELRGLELSQAKGCASCHGSSFGGGSGPTWQNIMGTTVALRGGSSAVVDRDYLTESIVAPDAKKRVGYAAQMPMVNLTDDEVAAIVDYIEALSR
jgi:cytochrome c oxidase subunit 2